MTYDWEPLKWGEWVVGTGEKISVPRTPVPRWKKLLFLFHGSCTHAAVVTVSAGWANNGFYLGFVGQDGIPVFCPEVVQKENIAVPVGPGDWEFFGLHPIGLKERAPLQGVKVLPIKTVKRQGIAILRR